MRFARARGSKGANEKTAEEATPWHVMKQQAAELRASSDRSHQLPVDGKNWKEELSKEELITQNSNAVWAEFEPTKPSGVKKKGSRPAVVESSDRDRSDDEQPPKKRKKSEKNKQGVKNLDLEPDVKDTECDIQPNCDMEESGIPKKNKHKQDAEKQSKKGKFKGDNGNTQYHNFQPSTTDEATQQQKNRGKKNFSHEKRNKKGDFGKEKDFKRRKPLVESKVLYINGRQVEVMMFNRFMVKKEDAERLMDLEQKLNEKGVPLEEIQRTLKLERRRAEKALAREKKNVCFRCRQSGHNFAECPLNFNSDKEGSGMKGEVQSLRGGTSNGPICYKCGSTEHKAFQCRVKQGKEDSFGFATCFICKEDGHISRQCPDNPRGLYPKGGACRLCGDVTHLKKDCPTAVAERESSKLTLGTIDGQTPLDALDNEIKSDTNNTLRDHKKINKIVKF